MPGCLLKIGLFSLFLFSCAAITRNEPVNEKDTLVIGDARLKFMNYDRWGPITINGTHDSDILLYIQNTQGQDKHIVRTETGGLFYVYGLEPDQIYQIKRLCHEEGGGSGMESVYLEPGKPILFKPVRGKVLVIGSIRGFIDKAEYQLDLEKKSNLEKVKEKFGKMFKESQWNHYDFVENTAADTDEFYRKSISTDAGEGEKVGKSPK